MTLTSNKFKKTAIFAVFFVNLAERTINTRNLIYSSLFFRLNKNPRGSQIKRNRNLPVTTPIIVIRAASTANVILYLDFTTHHFKLNAPTHPPHKLIR